MKDLATNPRSISEEWKLGAALEFKALAQLSLLNGKIRSL
jgi:hypothetical protein